MTTDRRFSTSPMDFGSELRRLRESAGLTREDIAAETKISPRILRALEEGKFKYLPEKVFSRNFVRQYGHIIGMDDDRLTEAFEAAWSSFEEESGSHSGVLVLPPPPKRSIHWALVAPIILAAVGLVLAAVLIWRTWRQPPELPGLGAVATPMAAVSPARPVVTPYVPAPATEVAGPTPVQRAEEGTVGFSVTVMPLGECWLRYRDATGKTSRELVGGGRTRRFHLPSPVRLTLGNAGAVSVEVEGRSFTDLGTDGQVVHLEVTPEGLTRLRSGSNDG